MQRVVPTPTPPLDEAAPLPDLDAKQQQGWFSETSEQSSEKRSKQQQGWFSESSEKRSQNSVQKEKTETSGPIAKREDREALRHGWELADRYCGQLQRLQQVQAAWRRQHDRLMFKKHGISRGASGTAGLAAVRSGSPSRSQRCGPFSSLGSAAWPSGPSGPSTRRLSLLSPEPWALRGHSATPTGRESRNEMQGKQWQTLVVAEGQQIQTVVVEDTDGPLQPNVVSESRSGFLSTGPERSRSGLLSPGYDRGGSPTSDLRRSALLGTGPDRSQTPGLERSITPGADRRPSTGPDRSWQSLALRGQASIQRTSSNCYVSRTNSSFVSRTSSNCFMLRTGSNCLGADEASFAPESSSRSEPHLPNEVDAIRLAKKYQLPVHEVKARLDEFRSSDGEKCGLLTRPQVCVALRNFAAQGAEIPDAVLHLLDVCHEGGTEGEDLTSFEDYVVITQAMAFEEEHDSHDRRVRSLAKRFDMQLSDVETICTEFEKFDTDKNGVIDRAEFETVLVSLLRAKDLSDIPKARLHRYWVDADSSGDGEINFSEFLVWYSKNFMAGEVGAGAGGMLASNVYRKLGAERLTSYFRAAHAVCTLQASSNGGDQSLSSLA